MKILVFEHIIGGGFNRQELPDSLASEGRLMLQALLDNLRSHAERSTSPSYAPPPLKKGGGGLPSVAGELSAGHGDGIAVMVMLDSRVNGTINTAGFDTVIIKPEQDSHEEFARLAQHCDAVWPIAPESDGVLEALCRTVELLGKILLTSPASAIAVTGNKFNTYQHLKQHHIATVPTRMFTNAVHWAQSKTGQWLVKPVDGVGCADSYILTNRQDFERMRSRKGRYIIQPHIQGKKTSLSCLFKQGRGWLLCANLQHFDIINRQYHLSEIIVNHHADLSAYQALADNIARAIPELWGYVGIDLIETPEQRLVLEINPRLTTSFAGINAALGINVAENVLQLLQGEPALKAVCSQPITIKVQQ